MTKNAREPEDSSGPGHRTARRAADARLVAAAGTTRWVVRRKAEVVAAVAGGLLSVDEACKRYTLSLEEFTSWQRAVDRSGMPGLRVTRIKQYRDQYERQQRY